MTSIKKLILSILVTVVSIGAAVFLGVQAGNLYSTHKAKERRNTITKAVVKQMKTIDIGDSLPDYVFEDLERKPVRLSEIINNYTLVTFVNPTCPSCIYQIEDFSATVPTDLQRKHFVLISPNNPRFLEDVRDKYHLNTNILYDHN